MKAKQKTLRERVFYPMLGTATIAVAIEILSLLTDNIIVGHVVGETGERSVLIIYRDDGAVADLSDPDGRIASFRGFILSSVAENLEMRKYLMTTGMNRAAFQIPYDWNSERSHNP